MKYLDEFRDLKGTNALLECIRSRATEKWVLMDVCGGQTHSLLRYGIERELEGEIELIHGPGCPVCVTSKAHVDFAIALSLQKNTVVATFGDMMRVPGSRESLLQARSRGGAIKMIYSPVDALTLAKEHPHHEIVLFAVGFETTAPATALAVAQADNLRLKNFSMIASHVRILPAMKNIMDMSDCRVQAFLGAGHVCSVTGFDTYQRFVKKYNVPVVVTGFEPIDLLRGIMQCVLLLEASKVSVDNCYSRGVQSNGNLAALALIRRVYKIVDRDWRGFGVIKSGGYQLRPEFRRFNAKEKFCRILPVVNSVESVCRGADVMSGKIRPNQCAAFGKSCMPDSPLGAPMVSHEGACSAYYRFDQTS